MPKKGTRLRSTSSKKARSPIVKKGGSSSSKRSRTTSVTSKSSGRKSFTSKKHVSKPSGRKNQSASKSGKKESSTSSSSSSSDEEAENIRNISADRVSKSSVCNLDFPVARVKSMLKVHNHGLRVSDKTAVFTTAVLQYLTTEILELSTNAAREEGYSRIQPKHVNRAIKMDPELFHNFKNSSVPYSQFISFDKMISSDYPPHHFEKDRTVLPHGSATMPSMHPVSSEETKPHKPGPSRRKG